MMITIIWSKSCQAIFPSVIDYVQQPLRYVFNALMIYSIRQIPKLVPVYHFYMTFLNWHIFIAKTRNTYYSPQDTNNATRIDHDDEFNIDNSFSILERFPHLISVEFDSGGHDSWCRFDPTTSATAAIQFNNLKYLDLKILYLTQDHVRYITSSMPRLNHLNIIMTGSSVNMNEWILDEDSRLYIELATYLQSVYSFRISGTNHNTSRSRLDSYKHSTMYSLKESVNNLWQFALALEKIGGNRRLTALQNVHLQFFDDSASSNSLTTPKHILLAKETGKLIHLEYNFYCQQRHL